MACRACSMTLSRPTAELASVQALCSHAVPGCQCCRQHQRTMQSRGSSGVLDSTRLQDE
jgi:hypothetical protein